MTTSEKAKELVLSFMEFTPAEEQYEFPYAKKCAIICVNEILKNFQNLHKPEYVAFDCHLEQRNFTFSGAEYDTHMTGYDMIQYWEDVKQEIEKM